MAEEITVPKMRIIIVGVALLAAMGAGLAWRNQQRPAPAAETTAPLPTAAIVSPPLEPQSKEEEEEEEEPFALEEARLAAYLDVREAALGAWRSLQKEQPEDLDSALAGARALLIARLEQRGMAPSEFAAHTVELYGPKARDSKPLSAEELETLEVEIIATESDAVKEAGDVLSEEEEAAHEAFTEAAQEKLDALVRRRTHALNAALRSRHAERIGGLAQPGFDVFARTQN